MKKKLQESAEFYFNLIHQYSTKHIANLFDVDVETLTRKVRESYPNFNKKIKSYTLFDKIDNEKSAYWLGYMYADGCVHKVGNTYHTSLLSIDHEHIEKFKLDINSNAKIYICKPVLRQYNCKTHSSIAIRNLKLGQDLINLGCIPKKSLILKFPTEEQVPNHFLRHFLRGNFDGDGSISYNKNSCQVDFLGTHHFVNGINLILNKTINTSIRNIESSSSIYRLRYYNRRDIRLIFKFLYDNHTVSLNRKYKKYTELINDFTRRELLNIPKFCSFDGCDSKHYGKGYCQKHYKKFTRVRVKEGASCR